MLADTIVKAQIPNVQLPTALKTMPPAVRALCKGETKIDGFLAPGHVAVITGEAPWHRLAQEQGLPFVISGFTGEELLCRRGLGILPGSGLVLRPRYRHLDAGSAQLTADAAAQSGCQCARVIIGAIPPTACPLFGTACTPGSPRGACMVSGEGSCHNAYLNHRNKNL